MARPHFVCAFRSSVDGRLGSFCLGAVLNNAAVNVNVPVFMRHVFLPLVCVPGSGVDRSFGNTVLSVLKNCQVDFHDSCPSLHPHRPRWGSSFLSSQMLVVICLSYSSHPGVCAKWC